MVWFAKPMVCFAKPMVCMHVAFHENNGNHGNDENDPDSYKKGIESWIDGNHTTAQEPLNALFLNGLLSMGFS